MREFSLSLQQLRLRVLPTFRFHRLVFLLSCKKKDGRSSDRRAKTSQFPHVQKRQRNKVRSKQSLVRLLRVLGFQDPTTKCTALAFIQMSGPGFSNKGKDDTVVETIVSCLVQLAAAKKFEKNISFGIQIKSGLSTPVISPTT